MSEAAEAAPVRAGFWRRFGAFLIDALVILVPIQIIVAVLFSATNGMVQTGSGLLNQHCLTAQTLPAGLQSQITNPNFASDCRKSFMGLDTMRVLVVGRQAQEGSVTTTVSESFWLDAQGNLATQAAYRADWATLLVFALYLIGFETVRGRTLGRRVVRCRVVAAADETKRPSLRQAVTRQAGKLIGAIPPMLGYFLAVGFGADVAELERAVASPSYFVLTFGSLALTGIWLLWIIVQMARKRDPIYDRLAGTAVLRA